MNDYNKKILNNLSYLTCIKPAGGQGNKIYSVYLLICYHFELHK